MRSLICFSTGKWKPNCFWATNREHPFYGHPLLSKYGGMLAKVSRHRGLERCKEKGLTRLPVAFSFQTLFVVQQLSMLEGPHRLELAQLGKRTASTVWAFLRSALTAC